MNIAPVVHKAKLNSFDEKLNDLITCDFLKSNNRKESSKRSFLYQLMNKSNRRDIFGKMFPEEFPDCKKRKKDDMFTF